MPTIHTVAQGETLTRIARQYNYSSWEALYNHPANAEFRKLRYNPHILYPGDKIVIPDIEPKKMGVSTTNLHIFCLSKPTEVFKLKIENSLGRSWVGVRAVMDVAGKKQDVTLNEEGILEVLLPNGDESAGALDVYLDPDSEEPTHRFELQLGNLDPVEELSGVQARCNLLGFDCGVADGIMGSKTREGVKAFQEAHDLDVDGIPGPKTKAKLLEVYGC